ncbi:fused MFS/spermidine synthase [Cellulosimicrobium sp. PMB13]|uniref:spermidine synthase n=1 Tax=Cellulosimicrobium sp. PMB13 TaxID=3120158 RepID=UPI003F4B90E0
MARRARRSTPADPASPEPPTSRGRRRATVAPHGRDLPVGPVVTTTGTARLERDRDHDTAVTLFVNDVPSSHVDLEDPGFLAFEYMQQMAAVIEQAPPGPLRVLHLGAAGCTLARWVEHTRPGSTQVGVDLDARLLELVREWFDLPRSPRLRLRADDAGHALTTFPDGAFDVVVRDVFAGDATPEHLVTAGTARQVRRVLRPGGVYLANCADRPPLTTARRELATLVAVAAPDDAVRPALDASAGDVSTAVVPTAEVPTGGVTRLPTSDRHGERLAAIAEPGQLKGRRYGNLVLVAVRPGATSTDLASAGLSRAARTLPLPARVLVGSELATFVGAARPFDDPPGPPVPSAGDGTGA